MSRLVLDLREPAELPPLEFILTDTDRANAKVDMAVLQAHRRELNAKDGHATTA